MGVLAENPDATNGVLVTMSWFSERARQRARSQRIKTIEGNELVMLLREHLGLDVLIGLPRWGQSS
jgi:restriction system protein